MTEKNFYWIGRACLEERPELFYAIEAKYQRLRSQAMNDIQQLPVVYDLFTSITGIHIKRIKGRNTTNTINQQRLFVAVAIYLYDSVFLHNYSGKMADGLRRHIATALKCNEVWISNVMESIKFEYFHLNTFQMQVNLIAYCIKMHLNY